MRVLCVCAGAWMGVCVHACVRLEEAAQKRGPLFYLPPYRIVESHPLARGFIQGHILH